MKESIFEPNRTPEHLTKEDAKKIKQQLASEGIVLEEDEEYFIARVEEDGKEVSHFFPKHRNIFYKNGECVPIEDDIRSFFASRNKENGA